MSLERGNCFNERSYYNTGKAKRFTIKQRIKTEIPVSFDSSSRFKEINHGNLITLADFYGVDVYKRQA